MDYDVMISCTFEADGPEDAVRQMVAYLLDNAAQAGYRVESETNESYISVFIDAENLEVY